MLEDAIGQGVGGPDPLSAYVDAYDAATGEARGFLFGRLAPPKFADDGVILRRDVAAEIVRRQASARATASAGPGSTADADAVLVGSNAGSDTSKAAELLKPRRPTRFYGSVDLDPSRPIKSVDAIVSAVIAELQRTPGTIVRLTLEVKAEAPSGFSEADVGVVRDNAKQLKFRPDATGFE